MVLVLVARQRVVRGTVAWPGRRIVVHEELILSRAAKGRRSVDGWLNISSVVSAVEASSASNIVVG